MVNLILELSKYVMIFLMAVYTWANFRYFSFGPGTEAKALRQTEPCNVFYAFSGLYDIVFKGRG